MSVGLAEQQGEQFIDQQSLHSAAHTMAPVTELDHA